jgi:fructose-bisphosphate aldolase class I
MNIKQYDRMHSGNGFIAALDQSGGSTPKALHLYGIDESQYETEAQMFDLMHQMRTRIITSPVFNSGRILAAILFEMTMERRIEGLPTAEYLWEKKGIVPFLKIDNGLMAMRDGVCLMKAIPELKSRLEKARYYGIFGTKARSVISESNSIGVSAVVEQQLNIAHQVLQADLIPIVEPEVDIKSPEKHWIEHLLKKELLTALDSLDSSHNIILKLTLPDEPNYYLELINHPRVIRVAALSGGYTQAHAVEMLAKNQKMIASFSRALTENLSVKQSPSEFDQALDSSIEYIYRASI